MHEMGIAAQIVEIAVASIPPEMTDVTVSAVNVRIGKLAAVVPESLTFCFNVAVQDTLLSGAILNIEEVPVLASCNDCRNRWTLDEPAFVCPSCGGTGITVISGRELDIISIELKDPSESGNPD